MTDNNTSIAAMRAAVSRAERTGNTDDEASQIAAAKRIGHATEDAAVAETSAGNLTAALVLRAMAIHLGVSIRNHRESGPLSGAILAAELCQLVLDIATEK